ncbi:GreA/GreB family elongation factor [Rhodobacter calidifons]|uniref:Transcription elongation factor n=1 Tax=Rhodobacter calidifons TaxID=2715277 RepID=A0ABX0G6N3_9RHOB|nr:GreA/GreB family elongation factor [Rhodobacter calidifons]NHB76527.1 transcription elongation factor [Rhodobacter calidifons]
MSRAFVNEDAGNDRPDLLELPVPPGPNIVTPRGLAALRERLAQRQADLAALKARADRLDKLPEAAAERDLRWLEARLKAAVVIDPSTHDLTEVAFGLAVTVADEDGRETTYEIVGEDEADATRNRIAPNSPLARALLGARVGDVVTWHRPAGAVELEILRIAHAHP